MIDYRFIDGELRQVFVPQTPTQTKAHYKFKKGHVPANKQEPGSIAVFKFNHKPYKMLKLRNGRWAFYHRLLWMKHNGEIPSGHVIRFADGNTLNCQLDNLQLTSRADMMKKYRKNPAKKKKSLTKKAS